VRIPAAVPAPATKNLTRPIDENQITLLAAE